MKRQPAPWWCPITPADLEPLRLGAGEIGAIQAPFSAPDHPDQNRIKTKSPSGLPGSSPDCREIKERIKPDQTRIKPGSIGSPPYKGVI
jgi:hypothetical protein